MICIDLTAVPTHCWWYTGLTLYGLLCWLVLGPIMSRRYYRKWVSVVTYVDEQSSVEGDAFALWLFSPLIVPFYVLFRFVRPIRHPFNWLVYGGHK